MIKGYGALAVAWGKDCSFDILVVERRAVSALVILKFSHYYTPKSTF